MRSSLTNVCIVFLLAGVAHGQQALDAAASANREASDSSSDRTAGVLDGFDDFVARVLDEWQVPGVAVAIIQNGEVTLAKGYGFRNLEQRLPVTPSTLFPIASITKPFVATATAILVDEGKLNWDDAVRQHLADFQLKDRRVAEHLTIRDCLSHRTGLGMAGLRWYGVKGWPEKHVNPEFLYRTLRYLEPTAPARSKFQYSNSGYFIMAQIITKVSGQPWDMFIRERLLDPLGFQDTTFSVVDSQRTSDFALPYGLMDGEVVRRPFFDGKVTGTAGGLNSSVEEMIRFLKLYLQRGKVGDARLLSNSRMKDLLTPEVVLPELNFYGSTTGFHGKGWQIFQIENEKWARHTGSLPGFTSVTGFCPKRKCAYIVLANQAFRSHSEVIETNIRSRLRGREPVDNSESIRKSELDNKAGHEERWHRRRPRQIEGTTPSHKLGAYVGEYTNPAYGDLTITREGGTLRWKHHGFRGTLKHYHYDTFDTEGCPVFNGVVNGDVPQELVTFRTGPDGTVESLSVPRPPVPGDQVFTRNHDSDPTPGEN